MTTKQVIVYSQPGWLFCKKTKEFLSQHGITFQERDVSQDPSALGELERMSLMTTPVTVIDGRPVVGFDETRLRELLDLSWRWADLPSILSAGWAGAQ